MSIKRERIAQLIKKEASDIIQFSLKDNRVGFVTITDVELTNDYSYATLFVSFMGDERKFSEQLETLKKAKGFIRTELGKRITIYKVPDLIFKIDDSLQRGDRIEKIIKDLK